MGLISSVHSYIRLVNAALVRSPFLSLFPLRDIRTSKCPFLSFTEQNVSLSLLKCCVLLDFYVNLGKKKIFLLIIHQFCYDEGENCIFWPPHQFVNQFNASLGFHLAKNNVCQMGTSFGYDEIEPILLDNAS